MVWRVPRQPCGGQNRCNAMAVGTSGRGLRSRLHRDFRPFVRRKTGPARGRESAQVDIRLCENIFHSAGLSLADGDGQPANDASLLAAAVSSSTVALIWQGGGTRPAIATGPSADQ